MGLSSSQARLLNLTSRMHQIEYKAARLEAEKLQMANESDRVYNEYLDALDKTKIQHKILTTDGSITYVDLHDYAEFLSSGFALVCNNYTFDGTVHGYKSEDGDYYEKLGSTNIYDTVTTSNPVTTAHKEKLADYGVSSPEASKTYYLYEKINGEKFGLLSTATQPQFPTPAVDTTLNWAELKVVLGITDENNFETCLTNIIQSGEVTIVAKDTLNGNNTFWQPEEERFNLFETSVSTNTNLQEVKDESELRRAEAKYEADMKKIDRKERKYDADLATFDNERNAIKQEMDTLKTVAKDNVERTFKIFS